MARCVAAQPPRPDDHLCPLPRRCARGRNQLPPRQRRAMASSSSSSRRKSCLQARCGDATPCSPLPPPLSPDPSPSHSPSPSPSPLPWTCSLMTSDSIASFMRSASGVSKTLVERGWRLGKSRHSVLGGPVGLSLARSGEAARDDPAGPRGSHPAEFRCSQSAGLPAPSAGELTLSRRAQGNPTPASSPPTPCATPTKPCSSFLVVSRGDCGRLPLSAPPKFAMLRMPRASLSSCLLSPFIPTPVGERRAARQVIGEQERQARVSRDSDIWQAPHK